MMVYRFADPWYLLLLLAVPVVAWWYWRVHRRKSGTIRFSDLGIVKAAVHPRTSRYRHVLVVLRLVGLAALIVAFARPQSGVTQEEIQTEGIDILLVVDVSSSMLAEDIAPNRLEAVKEVAGQFVAGRHNDRIGLVVFSGEAYTQAPLTLDYNIVRQLLGESQVGMIEDGTAIGMGLATAVKRLEASDAESRVVVLLTDGRNNRGEIDPVTAAQMAQALGVRVYAIGAGTRGEARVPVDDPLFGKRYVSMRVDIDEDALRQVAETTGGRYFRATDRESLEEIYREIDQLETTEMEVEHYTRYGELFSYPLVLGLALLLAEMGLGHTVLRKVP
jgi:Ca-activated chloride channel family protein